MMEDAKRCIMMCILYSKGLVSLTNDLYNQIVNHAKGQDGILAKIGIAAEA